MNILKLANHVDINKKKLQYLKVTFKYLIYAKRNIESL